MNKTIWIARDEDGRLFIFYNKPKLRVDNGYKYWEGRTYLYAENDLYPEVTFENSPQRLIPANDKY